jgi:hypothetical protein
MIWVRSVLEGKLLGSTNVEKNEVGGNIYGTKKRM